MRRIIGVFLLVAGVGFIAFGLHLGQEKGVFIKAIMVCLECIGIG